MDFGKALGTACATFAFTNIDNIFVLVTFFAESSTSNTLTPLRIVIGQYVGFTAVVMVSMIGFGASFLLPTEPIGFLGLLPILLGTWWFLDIPFPSDQDDNSTDAAITTPASSTTVGIFSAAGLKSIFKVASITVINGSDNISTYIPLFSQAKGAEMAVYVITYYVLLGAWCLAAFLIMKQRHVVRVARKYASILVPFFYLGLGIFIIIESKCYPWSVEQIDRVLPAAPGKILMGLVTIVVLLLFIGAMLWIRLRNRNQTLPEDGDSESASSEVGSTVDREPQVALPFEKSATSRSPSTSGTNQAEDATSGESSQQPSLAGGSQRSVTKKQIETGHSPA